MAKKSTGAQALAALSAAVSQLPVYAAAPPAETSLDYHFFSYREAPLAADKTSNPNRDRYDIDGHQLRVESPVAANWSLSADLTWESMSGASPWFITPGVEGKPMQVMSGASISDERSDLLLSASHYAEEHVLSWQAGISDENDYRAYNFGWQRSVEPLGKQYSYAWSLGHSRDQIFPTDGGSTRFPDRIVKADKQQWTAAGSFSQILHAASVVQLGFSYAYSEGFLSDPYKLVFVEGSTQADQRPEQRHLAAWFVRWRRFFANTAAALHLDYRFARDSWNIASHNMDAQWVQRLPAAWRWSVGLRYYSQSQAHFYAPYFPDAPEDSLVSSDYRLSPFGAVSLRSQVEKNWQHWTARLSWETYRADADYALGSVSEENPGLLDYEMLSVSVAFHF